MGEFQRRIKTRQEEVKGIIESGGGDAVEYYELPSELEKFEKLVEEAKKDMEKHALTLKIESAFVNPPDRIETLKAIPLSIWEKWFGNTD